MEFDKNYFERELEKLKALNEKITNQYLDWYKKVGDTVKQKNKRAYYYRESGFIKNEAYIKKIEFILNTPLNNF